MNLSPKQIVNQLDKYIIGQDDAKKAVAIALRNRYRRAQLPPRNDDYGGRKHVAHFIGYGRSDRA